MRGWLSGILIRAVLSAIMLAALPSCFTGVESTPKITERDIRKRKITETPERKFLADVKGESPREWKTGKEFFVTDNRIRLIFTPNVDGAAMTVPDSLAGSVLTLRDISTTRSITGGDDVQLTFTTDGGERLVYRPSVSMAAFQERDLFPVPFTVEMSVVGEVNSLLAGNTYYILSSRRKDADGSETKGLRYVPVRILAVRPGDAIQPLTVFFSDENGQTCSVSMTYGGESTSTRNFDTLFSFTDPRKRYPDITEKVWNKIMRSEIELGMTPVECRLALGAPNDYLRVPTTMGMAERWSYDNGVYLYFEDGMLKSFRR